ncbi:MAG: DUF3098 domain-containing protein [Prevotella sp.]|nr:DUF3098 domain-containing protein [Prevotella sp.]MBR1545302.1 DUF3098 domain-containing protein [Prevotella sp.]
MDRKNLAFDRVNYILLVVGMVIVVIGFILMSGAGSTESAYNPDIFSARRIKVAPVVCLIGFVSMIYAVMRKPKDKDTQLDQ